MEIEENRRQLERYNQLVRQYNEVVRISNERVDMLSKTNSLHPSMVTYERFCRELTLKYTLQSMPEKSGIYAYRNKVTGAIYVGQSVNMKKRLVQHFTNGKKKAKGHDSEFKNLDEWEFYVLEYIPRNQKNKLNEHEAYWICLAKMAVADKKRLDASALSGQSIISATSLVSTKTEAGFSTNRTKGNNVK